MSHIASQAVWLNHSAIVGSSAPTARLATFDANATPLNGTTRRLARRLAGVNRLK